MGKQQKRKGDKLMKKRISVIMALVLAASVAACGNKTYGDSTGTEPAQEPAVSETAGTETGEADSSGLEAVEPATLKLAHIYAAEHPFTIGLDEFVEAVLEASEGKLTIEHFSAAQLGDEPSIHEGLKNGTVDMAVMGISEAGKDYEPVLVMDAPFIFTDAEQMLAANESEIGQKLWTEFEAASGIRMMSPIYYGTRQLTTNRKVSSVAELSGMKIRVPSQENSVAVWQTLGATPTPMNLSEVYLSLQTGVVDGQENPIATIVSSGFTEVCDYMNMTSHSVQSCPLFISDSAYDALDPALREILEECVAEYIPAISQSVMEYEESMIDEIAAGGEMEVNRDVNVEEFRDKLADYIKENESVWGEGVYDALSGVTAN